MSARWNLPVLRLARPRQWTKNAVVLAAFFFALGDSTQRLTWTAVVTTLGAALLFCLISSGVYAINDACDAEADRQHPVKRLRPVAAGEITVRAAWGLGIAWLIAGLAAGFALSPAFAAVAALYVAVQVGYSLLWKHVALLDVFVIAGGFVLRAVAGAKALDVPISPWLLLCTLLLALFLALCKRRSEWVREAPDGEPKGGRAALEQYNEKLLDQLIGITGSATVVCYALYTQWPDTVSKFGTTRLGFTIPFVLFGVFRYLDLVYRGGQGERPEKSLWTDPPLLITLVLYAASLLAVFASVGHRFS